MKYDLHNAMDKARFTKRVERALSVSGIVEFSELKGRTRSQNAWLHLTIAYVASQCGYESEYVKEMYYKRAANAELYVRKREDRRIGVVEYLRSSSELTKEEMSLSLDRWADWCANVAEIPLPAPTEGELLDWVEVEVSRDARYP